MTKIEEMIRENLLKSLIALYIISVSSFLVLSFLAGPKLNINANDKFEDDNVKIANVNNEEDDNVDIQVEISGAVKNPGVFELESGSMLAVLVSEAGGISNDASELWITKNINLSSKLSDAQKIYIPYKWDITKDKIVDPPVATLVKPVSVSKDESQIIDDNDNETTQPNSPALINVNTASQEDIDSLPGIGPVYAARLIENRPYENLQDLEDKSSIPSNVVEGIKDLISY